MDREKVIKAFEICVNNEDGIVCKNCPYKEDKWNGAWEDETGKTCFQTLHADALALLKEQEAVVHCGDCENFCFDNVSPNAGRCMLTNMTHSKTWFCAHGKREEGR